MRSKNLPSLTLCFALALTVVSTAFAQDETANQSPNPGGKAVAAGVWASEDGSKVTYEASYFTTYQPVTAADMLRWIPGGAELVPSGPRRNNDSDKRGFGSGGDQVLINGKRISGKSNDIGSAMQRIQANAVSRIEVIRGTTAGLDVRSEGTLVNIVLDGEISGGAGSWQLHSGFYGEDPEYDGLLSYSNSAGRLNYLVSAQFGPYNRGNKIDRYEEYRSPETAALTERREILAYELDEALILNGSTGWSFDNGDTLNVNARIADREKNYKETTQAFVIGGAGTDTLQDFSRLTGLDWELGGDLEQGLGSGTLKTRLIYTRKDQL
ncbi:MAG: TonB-dependent receptor plug domain-containing protein, partial [Halioglobus sp.]|nr:TonB-dependent receptor plug domain-containing protein [Halioglobus sp.]